MRDQTKNNSIHLIITVLLFAICFVYFTPAFHGKMLGQSDVTGAQSTVKEIMDYRAKGTTVLWTNQIFAGMPAFQLWAPYPSNIAGQIVNAINYALPNPVGTVLIFLFGTYFLFCVLRLNPWLAAAGSIAFTFSSYNIILLAAGHSNQASAIAYFPVVLAGIIITLRGKYFLGGTLTALFLALELKANHIQMTYYLLLSILILVGIELYHSVKEKTTRSFFKSIAFLFAASLLALAVNASLIWSTFEYSKDSYRGKSNLTKNAKEPTNGLDRDYAYQYSQGVAECLTFLVPNAYGGGSGTEVLDKNSETAKLFINQGASEAEAIDNAQKISGIPGLSLYWGEKPSSTAGPFYFGATICFLFIFGLFVVRNRIKWWLLGTVLLTMFLSFGKNWPYVSDLFFNYFPLYNKFRTVESILAVTGLCFPVLAFLSIQEILNAKDKTFIIKKLKFAFYITGGLTLLLIIIPELLLNFRSGDEPNAIAYLAQLFNGNNAMANNVAHALAQDRKSLEQADAIRSILFITLTFGIVWTFIKGKINLQTASIVLLVLTLTDLWQIDKRYLKHSNFTEKQEAIITPREVDLAIAKDTDPNFRVYDASASIKIDIQNPFFHKSVGGYSAARLKRYDELMDNQLTGPKINQDVLNMLNTKYIITPDSARQALSVQLNNGACGNAWFIKDIKYVDNPDLEMQALSSFVPKEVAVVDKRYKNEIGQQPVRNDSTAEISLINYNPDHLTYKTSSTIPGIAIFSEIYYENGWKMYIDKTEQPYFRADYLLRAAKVPAGNHNIEFIFHPTSYYTGEKISLAASACLILALLGLIYGQIKHKRNEKLLSA